MIKSHASILVGVDDTPAGRAALTFALEEGRRRGSPVDIVTAWSWHSVADAPGPEGARESTRAYAQQVQDDAVAWALSKVDNLPVLSRQVIEGDAADVLLRLARSADYLVIGNSRKGPVRRLLLGSVGGRCLRHSRCPVLVIAADAAPLGEHKVALSAHA